MTAGALPFFGGGGFWCAPGGAEGEEFGGGDGDEDDAAAEGHGPGEVFQAQHDGEEGAEEGFG